VVRWRWALAPSRLAHWETVDHWGKAVHYQHLAGHRWASVAAQPGPVARPPAGQPQNFHWLPAIGRSVPIAPPARANFRDPGQVFAQATDRELNRAPAREPVLAFVLSALVPCRDSVRALVPAPGLGSALMSPEFARDSAREF